MRVRRAVDGGRPHARSAVLPGLLLAVSLALAACGQAVPGQPATAAPVASPAGSPAPMAGSATRISEGGQVTVEVTWGGPSAGPVFTVVLDTHAVDLDGYDLRALAVLRTDDGREVAPSGWDAPRGGHHREGELTFPVTAADGTPVIGPGTRAIEVLVRDVAGIPERSFRWPL
jgi:hypothetical protein